MLRLPACFRNPTTLIVIIAAVVLALGVSIPQEWGATGFDAAAQAARSTAVPTRQPQNAPVEADHPPVQSSDNAQAATWPDADIIAALEECVRLLTPVGDDDEVEVSKPIRNGPCGTPAPVILKRVAGVELSPSALVNCRIAAKLHQWMKQTVQPTAEELLGAPIRRIVTASAYMCRQRIGTTGDRPSEHSFANALDISAFVTADGRSIDVLTGWGQTARDRQAQAKSDKAAGGDARPLRDAGPADRSETAEGQFLRRMHEGACAVFGTVLGPEANEAHRNHLHLDLAARRHSAFCE
jgi:hypothetical protein